MSSRCASYLGDLEENQVESKFPFCKAQEQSILQLRLLALQMLFRAVKPRRFSDVHTGDSCAFDSPQNWPVSVCNVVQE